MLVKLRTFLFSVGALVVTIIYGLLSLLLWFVPAMLRHRIIISWCWLIIYWLRLTCGVRFEVIGKENLAKGTHPKVILSKHQSIWETLMLQGLCWPASTILKKELLNIPFFGWGLRGLQPIPIDRSNPREALKQVKREGVGRVQKGLNLLLFPEGTRVAPGKKNKYARSGPEIAISAEVDIIPVAVNAGHCWPLNTFLRYPGLITVVIGEPISSTGKTSKELITEVEYWIESQLERIEGKPAELVVAKADV